MHATVVATMAVGLTAFVSFDKTIELTIDGKTTKVHTFAGTVAGVLEREGITVGEYDSVVPGLDRSVDEGQRIAIRFGRPIDLDMDGRTRRVWVTATNVAAALGELGLRGDNMYVSASRTAPIGREGLTLRVLTPRDVTVIADGKRLELSTVATSVRQVLVEAGITLAELDEVSPQLAAAPKDGATIRIVRVDSKRVTIKVDIPFQIREIADRSLFRGEQKITREGVKGVRELTLDLIKRDGQLTDKDRVASRVLREPVTQIVRIGTRATQFARTGAENLNWAALAQCESGGNPRAFNPAGPYYGLYQFNTGTWRSVGGSGLPSNASPREQTYRAQLLYKSRGSSPWPVCGRRLFS
ncbi:MAG: ubiquitin-like domain-containing protein [Sporichthyaceae bacterium]